MVILCANVLCAFDLVSKKPVFLSPNGRLRAQGAPTTAVKLRGCPAKRHQFPPPLKLQRHANNSPVGNFPQFRQMNT